MIVQLLGFRVTFEAILIWSKEIGIQIFFNLNYVVFNLFSCDARVVSDIPDHGRMDGLPAIAVTLSFGQQICPFIRTSVDK